MRLITSYLVLFALTAGFIISLMLLQDWWLMIVVEDQTLIDSYHFGGESMISHGGFLYLSKNIYAWYTFVEAMLCISGFVFVIIGVVKKNEWCNNVATIILLVLVIQLVII